VTETLGTAAPDGSVTVPNIVASWANARNEPANSNKERRVMRRRAWLLKSNLTLFTCEDFTADLQKVFVSFRPRADSETSFIRCHPGLLASAGAKHTNVHSLI
jgi:hypothetical protein